MTSKRSKINTKETISTIPTDSIINPKDQPQHSHHKSDSNIEVHHRKKLKLSDQETRQEEAQQFMNDEIDSDEIKRPRDKIKRSIKLLEFGNFEKGDRVSRIQPYQTSQDEKERVFRIFWKERRDGVQPRPSFADYDELKHQTPFKIIQWWEGMWLEAKKVINQQIKTQPRDNMESDVKSGISQQNFEVQIQDLDLEDNQSSSHQINKNSAQNVKSNMESKENNNLSMMEIEIPNNQNVETKLTLNDETTVDQNIKVIQDQPKSSQQVLDIVKDDSSNGHNSNKVNQEPNQTDTIVHCSDQVVKDKPLLQSPIKSKSNIIEELLEEIARPIVRGVIETFVDSDLEEVTESTFLEKSDKEKLDKFSSARKSTLQFSNKALHFNNKAIVNQDIDEEKIPKVQAIPSIIQPIPDTNTKEIPLVKEHVIKKLVAQTQNLTEETGEKKKQILRQKHTIISELLGLADKIKGKNSSIINKIDSEQKSAAEPKESDNNEQQGKLVEDELINLTQVPDEDQIQQDTFQCAQGEIDQADLVQIQNQQLNSEEPNVSQQDDFQIEA